MAEEENYPKLDFIEVLCQSSGKKLRFASRTDAGFALNVINKKLLTDGGNVGSFPLAFYIEAVKDGEDEPVIFGPSSMLLNYGPGWKFQTAIEPNAKADVRGVDVGPRTSWKAHSKGNNVLHSKPRKTQPGISLLYIGKISLAFVLLFAFGAVFTLLLENLPQFILSINSFL